MTGAGQSRSWIFSDRGFAMALTFAFVFYLPFLPRSFVGDDWLWLAHGARVLTDPSQLFTRPIYGYFRPLFAAYVAAIYALVGLNVYVFGLLAAAVHTANGILFYRMLRKFGIEDQSARLASVIFTFYFLNCSAICWISAGADLLTLTFLIVFSTRLADFHSGPSLSGFLALLALGLGAILIKETGAVCLVLFLVYQILNRSNPFTRRRIRYTATFLLLFTLYAIAYFQTRSVIDKALVFSPRAAMNLWYLFVYLFIPLPERFVSLLSQSVKQILMLSKALFAFALPGIWAYLLARRTPAERFLLLWPLLMLIPVSFFDWNVGLFDLYPSRTASRFMYVATPGFGALIGMILAWLLKARPRLNRYVAPVLILFVAANLVVVMATTRLYAQRQSEDAAVYRAISDGSAMILRSNTLVIDDVCPPEITGTPSGLNVIESMVYLATGHEINVRLETTPEENADGVPDPNLGILSWEERNGRYVVRAR